MISGDKLYTMRITNMKNWNTDESKFKNADDLRVWKLVQKIEYGLDGEPLSKKDVVKYWSSIKDEISPENKRLLEFYIWGKQYSLPISNYFWTN